MVIPRSLYGCWWLLLAVVCRYLAHVEARPRITDPQEDLPECQPHSVCGYVQLNMQGVNAEQLCRCREGLSCPLEWDPLDGMTISHGNDQYKYCGRAPRLNLCSTEEVVYSTYVEMYLTGMIEVNDAKVHCLCPPTHIFAQNNSRFHQYNSGIMAIQITHLCRQPPICEPVAKNHCMSITENFLTGSTIIKRHCACPLGLYCSSDIRLAKDRVQKPNGVAYDMVCL